MLRPGGRERNGFTAEGRGTARPRGRSVRDDRPRPGRSDPVGEVLAVQATVTVGEGAEVWTSGALALSVICSSKL